MTAHAPTVLEECVRRWDLRVGDPFAGASVSWVAPAITGDGAEVVLKINPPSRESEHEADALAWWDGDGAARLVDCAPDLGALLLERCRPATQLWSVQDDEAATRTAAGVLRRLWKPTEGAALPFRTLAAEAEHWSRTGALPPHWRALARTQEEVVVCHQDLHGGNVIHDAKRGWVAIDAKPLLGERAFDVASLVRDRRPGLTVEIVRRRMDILVEELALDRERVRGWGIVHALAWGHPREAGFIAAA